MAKSPVDNNELKNIRNRILASTPNKKVRAWQIAKVIFDEHNYTMDESTILPRFIEMGEPLSGNVKPREPQDKEPIEMEKPEPKSLIKEVQEKEHRYDIPDEFKEYIPKEESFDAYIERGIDKRLAIHYNAGKYPLTQGKQGTGKSFGHEYYAYKHKLPLFVYTCNPDFKLEKLFGDKTIVNGNVEFREAQFCQGIQIPSVHVFDEIQQVENKNLSSFHSIMQERRLFVKDADNGIGKWYKLHPECRIGFAQNPKSAKYIGGSIKPSNFLGRCTFLTYPEFTKTDIKKAITKKFPTLEKQEIENFVVFYFASVKAIEKGQIPVDISIRQLCSVIELYLAGLPLRESIEDGLSSIMDAASQPHNKEVFFRLAQGVWAELMDEAQCDKISKKSGFARMLWGGGNPWDLT